MAAETSDEQVLVEGLQKEYDALVAKRAEAHKTFKELEEPISRTIRQLYDAKAKLFLKDLPLNSVVNHWDKCYLVIGKTTDNRLECVEISTRRIFLLPNDFLLKADTLSQYLEQIQP